MAVVLELTMSSWKFNFTLHHRVVVRTGLTGAFPPVIFEQRVLSTGPEKKFPLSKWKPLKKWCKRVKKVTNFFEEGENIPILHPSCETPNESPVLGILYTYKEYGRLFLYKAAQWGIYIRLADIVKTCYLISKLMVIGWLGLLPKYVLQLSVVETCTSLGKLYFH